MYRRATTCLQRCLSTAATLNRLAVTAFELPTQKPTSETAPEVNAEAEAIEELASVKVITDIGRIHHRGEALPSSVQRCDTLFQDGERLSPRFSDVVGVKDSCSLFCIFQGIKAKTSSSRLSRTSLSKYHTAKHDEETEKMPYRVARTWVVLTAQDVVKTRE